MSEKNSSRRDFIKASSALAAAGISLNNMSIVKAANVSNDDTIRIGLIGCGGRGTGAAFNALSTSGKVKLVAMGDAFEDRLEGALRQLNKKTPVRVDVAAENKFIGFDAYQKVIDSDVDLVILTTPPGFRPIHFEAAIAAGKHVFMEKPVAVDAPGIRKVLATAEEAKKKSLAVGVGLQRRHDPSYIETIKRIQDGAIGDFIMSRVYWNGGGVWVRNRQPQQTEMEYQMRNWYYFNWLCGDHIAEQHIHNLDVGNWVRNSLPVEANAIGGREVRRGKQFGEIFDHFAVEYTYEDGSKMMSQCRHIRGCWSSVSEHIHGSTGTAVPNGKINSNGEKWRFRDKSKSPYQIEHDDLFAAIRSGTPYNEAKYGAESTMTSILGRMAAYSGKVIQWKDAIASNIDLSPKKYDWNAAPPVLPNDEGFYKVAIPGKTKTV